MTIHLPEDLESFIHAKVQSGRFASEDEAVAEAVRRLKQWELAETAEDESATANRSPAWKRVLENMKDVPDAVFDRIPADSSEQLDHYLYGVRKRPVA